MTGFGKLALLFVIVLLFYLLITPATCTDEVGAKDALIKAGYHPIEVGGYGYFQGSEDDTYVTKFKAYSPDSSQIVTGVVCSGVMKGKTIRLD